jgi:hypothetical protein
MTIGNEHSHKNQKTDPQLHNKSKGKYFDEVCLCLYLDEFAASRVFAEVPAEGWEEIAALIKQGVSAGKFLCPYSVEQMIESSGLDRMSASFLDNETRKFSSGWCFYNEADISANYLICRVRQTKMQKHHFIHQDQQTRLGKSDVYEEIGKLNETFRQMIKEAAHSVNIIREAARNGSRGKKDTRDFLVKQIKNDYTEELQKRMFWLGYYGSYDPAPITLAGLDLLFWADEVSRILTGKHFMTQIEAQSAFWVLEKEGIDAVPSLSIRASLEAMIAYKGTIETPNDQMDILRIAGALPFADIMLIDGAKAHDVRELKLDKKFQTNIYSGKKKDLENLRELLTDLL